MLDTRPAGETVDDLFEADGKLAAGGVSKVTVAGRGNVPADAIGVELNLTAIAAELAGFATLYPCNATPPTASSLNFQAKVNIANATTVALNDSGEVCIYTSATAHYALDIVAYIAAPDGPTTTTPTTTTPTTTTPTTTTTTIPGGDDDCGDSPISEQECSALIALLNNTF